MEGALGRASKLEPAVESGRVAKAALAVNAKAGSTSGSGSLAGRESAARGNEVGSTLKESMTDELGIGEGVSSQVKAGTARANFVVTQRASTDVSWARVVSGAA